MGKAEENSKEVDQLHYRDALRVIKTLEGAGFESRLSGGCVRDRLLGRVPKDYDVASTAKPDEVCTLFEQKGFKVIPTGIDHGTVTVLGKFTPIEVTTLRKDVETDGRHATVAFGFSFEEDAERRDFTINAMYEDQYGQIYDYFDGQRDLKEKRLRFVGDPEARVREDYLRILRLFRFWSRLGFQPEAKTLQVIRSLKDGLSYISQERITSELLQLLSGPHVLKVLLAMVESKILADLLPACQKIPERTVQAVIDRAIPDQSLALLAALLLFNEALPELEPLGKALRLPNQAIDRLALILWWHDHSLPDSQRSDGEFMEEIDAWEAKSEPDICEKLLLPIWPILFPESAELVRRIERLEQSAKSLRKMPIPLSGRDVMVALKLKPGPQIGQMMKELRIGFRNREWQGREEGLLWLEQRWPNR